MKLAIIHMKLNKYMLGRNKHTVTMWSSCHLEKKAETFHMKLEVVIISYQTQISERIQIINVLSPCHFSSLSLPHISDEALINILQEQMYK